MLYLVPKILHRGVEQLVARRAHNPKVAGSSPVPATKRKIPLIREGFPFYSNSIGLVYKLSEVKSQFYRDPVPATITTEKSCLIKVIRDFFF